MAKAKKGGLGRGLDALFSENSVESAQVTSLPLLEIEPNTEQPRRSFTPEALAALADSISRHGLLQPIVVRPLPGGRYRIVAGERRWRACRQLGLTEVPVVVRELSEQEAAEATLIENLQREDLTPIEEAEGFRRLIDEFGLTQEALAERMGRSRPAIANALRLLNLPSAVRELVDAGELSGGHARALLALPEDQREPTAQRAVAQGLTVRQLEALAKKGERSSSPPTPPKGAWNTGENYYREIELALREALGNRVKITRRGKESGALTIEFQTKKQLGALAERLAQAREEKG